MELNTRDIFNLKKMSSYFCFCLGIAMESLAVLILMIIPLVIAVIASKLWP